MIFIFKVDNYFLRGAVSVTAAYLKPSCIYKSANLAFSPRADSIYPAWRIIGFGKDFPVLRRLCFFMKVYKRVVDKQVGSRYNHKVLGSCSKG